MQVKLTHEHDVYSMRLLKHQADSDDAIKMSINILVEKPQCARESTGNTLRLQSPL